MMLYTVEYVWEWKVDGLRKLDDRVWVRQVIGCGENSNERTCSVQGGELNDCWATVSFSGMTSSGHWFLLIIMILTIGGNHQYGYSTISFDESVYYSLSWQKVTLMLCWFYRAAQILCKFCPVRLVRHSQHHLIVHMMLVMWKLRRNCICKRRRRRWMWKQRM
jgi:hypothetical protein